MAPYWIPITFCLLGLAWQENPEIKEFYDYSTNVFDQRDEELEIEPSRKNRRRL